MLGKITPKTWLLFFLLVPCLLKGQTLNQQIQTIKANHDLMGGVVTVLCGNNILESIPFGMSDLGRNITADSSTVFRIASISKTVTAIAMMQLYEQGLFSLDQDISSILGYPVRNPNFPAVPISPRMLLSHTSSLIDGTTYNNFLSITATQIPVPDISELLTPTGAYYVSNQFNNIMPGTYFNYANINYGIIGTLIEKLSNQRFDTYCRDHILLPLSITASFNVTDLPDIDKVAVLYRKVSGIWTEQAENYLGSYPVYGNLIGYLPGTNGLRFSPQGGLRISGNGLSRIFLALMNHGSLNGTSILQDSTLQRMLSIQWQYNGSNGNNYYGLFRSWGLGIHRITNSTNQDVVLSGSQAMFGHPGEAYGLVSDAYIDTIRKVGLVFITNGCGTGYTTDPQSAFYTVEKDVFDAVESVVGASNCIITNTVDHDFKNQTMIYPNPSTGMVYIQLPSDANETQVEVYSNSGVLEKMLIIKENTYFNIPKKGMYLVRVKNTAGIVSEKIIILPD